MWTEMFLKQWEETEVVKKKTHFEKYPCTGGLNQIELQLELKSKGVILGPLR